MKKITKIALILAAVLAVIGLTCVTISVALGFTWGSFRNMVKQGEFNFALDSDPLYEEESKGVIQTVEEEFRDLDIEFGAGELEVSYADVEKVQVQQEDVKGFACYVEEGTLHIKGNNTLGASRTDGKILIQLPQNLVFDEVDMEIGAGQANLESLVANSVDIEVGAGEASLNGLDVKELNAETGAGKLYVKLVGGEVDYSYEAECGIGEVLIGQTSISGLGGSKNVVNPGANRHMDLECGVGQIHIEFQE